MITKIAGGFFPKFLVFPTPRSVVPTDHQNIQKSVQNLRLARPYYQKHTKVCTKLKISMSRLLKTFKSLRKT